MATNLVLAIQDEGDDGLIFCESNTHEVMTVSPKEKGHIFFIV